MFHLFRPGGLQNYGAVFLFPFFFFFGGEKPSWGLVFLFVCLFVCLYILGPKKLFLGKSIVNPSPLVKSNGSPCVGVVLVLTLLEYDQYDQRKKVHCPDYVFGPRNTFNCCQKTTAF